MLQLLAVSRFTRQDDGRGPPGDQTGQSVLAAVAYEQARLADRRVEAWIYT